MVKCLNRLVEASELEVRFGQTRLSVPGWMKEVGR